MVSDFLLTIAIPTYNRATYLDQLLQSLSHQLDEHQNLVELLIVDNASSDSTSEVVNEFSKEHQVRYIKNDSNLGSDNNFIKCFSEAKGKYVLLFGDDDLFLEGSIASLVKVLSSGDYGLVHLKVLSFNNEAPIVDMSIREAGGGFEVDNINEFMSLVHINTTFISANVVNRSFFQQPIQDLFLSSNLVQMAWTFNAALNAKSNYFIGDQIIAGRLFNSSGYDLCTVFVKNINDIVDFYVSKGTPRSVFDGMFKRLLMVYYPANIVKSRCGHHRVTLTACRSLLWKYYRGSIFFWLFVIPAAILPKKIAWFIFSVVNKFRSK